MTACDDTRDSRNSAAFPHQPVRADRCGGGNERLPIEAHKKWTADLCMGVVIDSCGFAASAPVVWARRIYAKRVFLLLLFLDNVCVLRMSKFRVTMTVINMIGTVRWIMEEVIVWKRDVALYLLRTWEVMILIVAAASCEQVYGQSGYGFEVIGCDRNC